MKFNKKFLIVAVYVFIFGYIGAAIIISNKKDKLRQEINSTKQELQDLPHELQKQERDSIANFNKTSPNALVLNKMKQQRLNWQTRIAQIAEISWREYWNENFLKYKNYIDSSFTKSEKLYLAQYVGRSHFTLTCDIDTNYYTCIDDILYGPYWLDFSDILGKHQKKLQQKYIRVRMDAMNRFPYIFTQNVFYDGAKITTMSPTQEDTIFTHAIKYGRDEMALKNVNMPNAHIMQSFNMLRNKSKIFTSDLQFLIQTIHIDDFYDESSEYLDLSSKIFNNHAQEILLYINQIMRLNPRILDCESNYKRDINQIHQYYEAVSHRVQYEKLERIAKLDSLLNQR